jgi:multidrug efflux system membrane fusion protein
LQGTVQTDQAQVDNAKLQLSYTKVVAPLSGRLGLKQADLGSVIRAGDVNGLVSITQTQPIALVFAVPEANLRQITRKLRGKEPVPVEAWDRDQRNRLGEGRVITTDNAIDATTGTIKLKAEFANADAALFPNQFVNVRLQVDSLNQVLAVPATAIQRGARGSFVYVVKDDGSVNVRGVRMGTTEGDWVSVQGDVTVGEKVVTDGADRLREGAKVEVVTPPPLRGGPGGPRPIAASSEQNKPLLQTGIADNAIKKEAKNGQPAATASAAKPPGGDVGSQGSSTGSPAPKPTNPAVPPAAGDLPPWFDRMPPEMQERFKAMNPQERQAFIEKARERRKQREAQGG